MSPKPRKSSAASKSKRRPKQSKADQPAIWWLVDPFHDEEAFREHAVRVLLPLAKALNAPIRPVTFIDCYRALEPAGQWFPLLPVVPGSSLESLQAEASKRLARLAGGATGRYFLEPLFLTHDSSEAPSLRQKVEAIEKESKRRGALLIALHTHGYRGLQRLYMGSFAETFMLLSTQPCLFISPECAPSSSIKRILFPTDFAKSALKSFQSVLDLAARMKARITIVNYHHTPVHSVFFDSETLAQLAADDKLAQKKLQAEGLELVTLAKKRKVAADFVLLAGSGVNDPASEILRYATNQRADLIALAAESGAVKSALLGATSRALARAASCPVLLHRS